MLKFLTKAECIMSQNSSVPNNGDHRSAESLFQPIKIGTLELPNRIVMAPMGRTAAKMGVLSSESAPYYRRRAEGGVGLIIGEATGINRIAMSEENSPFFHGSEALAAWAKVCKEIHAAGGHFIPQLWHAGLSRKTGTGPYPDLASIGPSDWCVPDTDANLKCIAGYKVGEPMTRQQMDEVINDFGTAAAAAQKMGCDGIEIHGAHGYLIDQFFWPHTNRRTDNYGASNFTDRTRFAVEVITEIRQRTGPDFPIFFRLSQWKTQDYDAKIVHDENELEQLLTPLVKAGVDVFHVSTRRFWDAAFPGSELSLAGWTKKIPGVPTIIVGSVGLDSEFAIAADSYEEYFEASKTGEALDVSKPMSLDRLIDMFEREEFDLVAVGRAVIANPDWANMVRDGNFNGLKAFDRQMLATIE